jgi:hypothetical protein
VRCVDGIPKAIMLCLVNEVKEQMQNALLDVLYKRDESGQNKVEKLLEEDADFTRQKTRCQEFLRLLDEAAATVREVQVCLLSLPYLTFVVLHIFVALRTTRGISRIRSGNFLRLSRPLTPLVSRQDFRT